MVIVKLDGGLGNQLFQYAMGKALSQRRGAVLKLDPSGLANPDYRTRRRYELAPFHLPEALATPAEVAALTRSRPRLLDRLMPWRTPRRPDSLVVEPHYHVDPAMLELPGKVYLSGYWQSERYFADVAPTIREAFTMTDPPTGANAELVEQIVATQAISLHVRRGDYLTDPAVLAMHGVCSPDYYAQAVAYMAERVTGLELFLFSDEPDWARANLSFAHPTHIVDINGPDQCHEDLRLMSHCKHHVIANSTFGWWGAWLNPSGNKIVTAPQRWFAQDRWDVTDLIPANWVRL